ncbi:MAG: hypothetical protein ACI4XL_00690 [Bacillus sp. (in: firmicutes)]
MKKLFCLLLFTIVLAGCDDFSITKGTEGFVTQIISERQMLIGNEICILSSSSMIQDTAGNPIKRSELDIGMKAQAFFESGVTEGQVLTEGHVHLLLVFEDDESLRESEMIRAVLTQLKKTESQNFIITNVEKDTVGGVYTMDVMSRSNLDIGYTITVDAYTYKILHREA